MSVAATVLVTALAVVLGIVLAYVPLRMLMNKMSYAIAGFIKRRRDRRTQRRETPERRE